MIPGFFFLLLMALPDPALTDLLSLASEEKKPIIVLVRPDECARCEEFERTTIAHPAIVRRRSAFVYGSMPGEEEGISFFDRAGTLRAQWPLVPDTTNFGVIIDSVVAVAPHFELAIQLRQSGRPHEAEIEAAVGLARIGRVRSARAALARARTAGDAVVEQKAAIAAAVLDAGEGKREEAIAELQKIVANPAAPNNAADASAAIETIRPSATAATAAAIRILPLGRQIVSGRHLVRTLVTSSAVASAVFAIDGRRIARVERPPFATTIDFGALPERHRIAVVALDRSGKEIGRDERVVNETGESFWLRLIEPREGAAEGSVRVVLDVRVPTARKIERLVISWNEAKRALLTAPPWQTSISVPRGQAGVLSAVATLEDGRTAEDAVLLNARGAVDRADVQLVGLPITIVSRGGTTAGITPDAILVQEGNRARNVESIATAAETPLTVGILIDASDSMQASLPDVQEAAIRFLETILGDGDRAFVVAFDTRARLVQPPTSDVALLRRRIMSIRPDGLTALHDAMALGLLQFEGVTGRRGMIVFSDGVDITSAYSAAEVSELARRANVPVHVINSRALLPATVPDDTMARLAEATGAVFHSLGDLGALPAVYSRIEAVLRAQVIAFIRTDRGGWENEWRPIAVDVRGEGHQVFAPAGYYAPW